MRVISRRTLLGTSVSALLTARAAAALSGSATVNADADSSSSGSPGGSEAGSSSVRTGGSRTIRIDDRYNVWVKQVGSTGMPILTLHGGPGWNHMCFECFEDFLPAAGLSFWYYDQLGCGFSDAPDDKSLWTLERYLTEVEQVRRGLGVSRLLLYGHSWGSILAMEYAVRYPEHVSAIVASNMTASIPSLHEYNEQLLPKLLAPSEVEVIMRVRKQGDYKSPEYQKIVAKIYSNTICRLDPWPEPVARSARFANASIYNVMCGPDDLTVVGNLQNWDIWGRLSKISAPTLVLGAHYDEMSPEQLHRMGTLIPHSQVAICPNGSHFAMYDDQRAYFNALIPFLRTHAHARTT